MCSPCCGRALVDLTKNQSRRYCDTQCDMQRGKRVQATSPYRSAGCCSQGGFSLEVSARWFVGRELRCDGVGVSCGVGVAAECVDVADGGVISVVVGESLGQGCEVLERAFWTIRVSDCDCPVQVDERVRVPSGEQVVERLDLSPVGAVESAGLGVDRSNGRLELVVAELMVAECCGEQRETFGDHGLVPELAVLSVEGYEFAVAVDPGRSSGVGEEQQRE